MINTFYPASSPYYTTDVVNGKFLDIMINRRIDPQPDDVRFTITPVYQYRPDTLAYDLYSDPRLWWVFAQRNPNTLKDPYFDFVAGVNIFIPKISILKTALGI